MNRIIAIAALILGAMPLTAQEFLTAPALPVRQQTVRLQSVSSTLQLPFIDDFSSDSNAPDQRLWTDRGVWINNTFGINPYSVGVATFDAIDSDGLHYGHASSTPYLADFLTSQPIDLSKADSTTTYLSFYYQPQGNGNAPEECDSLVLQITSGDGVWTNLWAMAGTDLPTFRKNVLHLQPNRPDTLEFALVMLPIRQSKYFTDKFQFRFFNYASLAGSFNPSATINCDHWNIDFVYLNDGRSASDTVFYDIALVEPAATVLKNYTSVPWSHYESAINTENTRLNIHIRNHWERTMKAEVRIRIKDVDRGVYLNDSITMGTGNYDGQENNNRLYAYDDNPIVHDNRESATYLFECELYTDKDELIRGNNRSYTYQHFGNYYAYDDGTAENAYGVDAASSQVAYLYTPYKADQLCGLSICFLPSNPVESAADNFFICAWENNNGKPGRQLRCDEVVRPEFSGRMNEFMTFEFSEPLPVEKSIFVGWQQTSKLRLNVGWDVNRFSQSKIFYNTTGDWLPTSFTGSLMLRPIFGSITTDIAETESTINLSVYPNPVSDWLTISGLDDNNCQLAICNTVGQTILCAQGTRVNVSSLQSGIYIVRINHNGGTSALKFIKK
ncbi:MAG: T9SS type A sorting domain-containing protein [Salinivirgaceae bacterium]|nr:T9SS type A sorting domain-containing protein [Salinivirgaceae bacterium]